MGRKACAILLALNPMVQRLAPVSEYGSRVGGKVAGGRWGGLFQDRRRAGKGGSNLGGGRDREGGLGLNSNPWARKTYLGRWEDV